MGPFKQQLGYVATCPYVAITIEKHIFVCAQRENSCCSQKMPEWGLTGHISNRRVYHAVLSRHTVMFKWYPATSLIPVVPSTHPLVRHRVQYLIREESTQGETQLLCLHLSACELPLSIQAHIHKSSHSAGHNTRSHTTHYHPCRSH